jgi:predicted lipoprotein with Yx(FWY)xxD motif
LLETFGDPVTHDWSTPMNKTRILFNTLIVAIVGVVVLVAATAGSAKKGRSAGTTVGVMQTALGKVLVGQGGRSLYLFVADKPGVSKLSRAGFAVWPALAATGAPRAGGGASGAKLGTIASVGAKRHVTYAGHPLYYFVGDQRSGSTSGQGLLEFGARWYVVSPNGNAVTTVPVTPAPAAPESNARSYGY